MVGGSHLSGGRGSAGEARPEQDGIWAADDTAPARGIDLSEYWRMAIKHRFVILGCIVVAIAIGIAATLLMTPIYKSTTLLQIDREAARVIDDGEVAPKDAMVYGEEFFQTQYGLITSISLAERVVDSLGLANSNAFLEAMEVKPPEGGTPAEQAAKRRRKVVQVVRSNLDVAPIRGSRLVNVSFSSPDPQVAARVANAFAENFIAANLDRKFQASGYAREFLEERIAQTKSKLEESERALVAYASSQQIINVTEAGPNGQEGQSLAANNLTTLNAALGAARAARVAAEENWRQARNVPVMNLPEVQNNGAIQRLTESRAQLEGQYQQNLSIYRPEYPAMVQLKAQIDELDAQIQEIANGVRDGIRSRYIVAANEERSLQGQVNALKGDVLDIRDRSIQYNIIQREVDTSRTLYDGLLQRYKEVSVSGGVATNNVSIVDPAQPPLKPYSPKGMVNVAIALLIGMGLGVLAAFVLEALDESLATPDDVEKKIGVPLLGIVPLLGRNETPMEALSDIRSGFSEAYYSLRTALQFSTPNGAPRTLLVSSSRPAEGKSTTAYATALNLARVGKRVLLADGDLRNPSMHHIIGLENDRGMSNLLSGSDTVVDLARPTADKNLFFIPCGPLPPNPAELWGSDRLRHILNEAGKDFDHVVIDGPPVLGFADAPLLASTVDGVVFVVESNVSRRGQVRSALRRLLIGDARLLGIVLTKFNTREAAYAGYDYGYDYNYGADAPSTKASKR